MDNQIQTVSIAEEARSRFLRYMVSVVKGRAIPDIRDGLKPVQRRILFAMYHDLSLHFDRRTLKSAKIVGETMGSYHPHGDGAIYDAMVRMAQDWVMRVPLVNGMGCFGSVDGDPPAAYRYTEAKLTRAASFLLDELGQETVPMLATYDGVKMEPEVLPAQYPNLLVNGSQGIAVGLATNIPPHNLGEVLKACILLIENPDATMAQLLDKVKGPDFPLGGKIISDRATLKKIYEDGRGSLKIQGEWKLEEYEKGKQQIVITSIPYGVEKGALEMTIGGIIEERKVPQLLGLSNESNEKEGIRVTLEIKPGTDPALVMAYLYKHTDLQKNFAYNMTALVPSFDGTTMIPRDSLSLKEFLRYFLDYRLIVVRKRFEFKLRQLQRRIHILDGFRIIFDALDEAIKLIRESNGKADAAEKLMPRFDLDEEQANAILDAQLYKIASMEIQKILDELAEKKKEAAAIETILASETKLWGVIRAELEQLQSQDFVTRRRTRTASDEDVLEFDAEAYIVRENTNVVLTRDGWIKRVGKLASVESTRVREGDEVIAVVPASTIDNVILFADDGTAYTMRVNEVPSSSGYGEPITKFFKLADQVRVVNMMTTDSRFTPTDDEESPPQPHLIVATSAGMVLRLPLSSYRIESTKNGRRYVKLSDSDKVVMVRLLNDEDGVMLASQNGNIIHFAIDTIPAIAGVGKGVVGIKLVDNDTCLGGTLIGGRFDKLTLEKPNGKTEEFGGKMIERQGRGGSGKKQGQRIRFERVVPPPIELADWDNLNGKPQTRKAKPETNGHAPTNLFE